MLFKPERPNWARPTLFAVRVPVTRKRPDGWIVGLRLYGRLLAYLKGYVWTFALSIFGYLLFAATQPMLAKLMEQVVEAIETKNTDARLLLPLLAIGIFALRGLGTFIGVYFNDYVGASVIRNIKRETYAHLVRLPKAFFDRTSQGDLLHRLQSGVGQVQAAITNALKTVIREGLTVIFLLGYVFYLNWKLSLIFLLVAPFLAFSVSYVAKRFKKIARSNEKILGRMMQNSKELIGNYGVVRSYGAEQHEINKYGSALDESFDMQMKIRRISAMFSPVSQLLIAAAMSLIIFLLLDPAVLDNATTGELVGYLTAVALIPKPLRQLSGVGMLIQRGIIGAEIIFRILDEEPERDTGTLELTDVRGDIDIRGLSFRYAGSDTETLKDINLTIGAGEMVALVGRSGSGKSTLASLIYRAYEIDDGTIFIDGVDVNRVTLKSLRSRVATVSQNIELFDDTIRSNVAYGIEHVSDDQVWAALRRAHADEFVESLPQGIDTVIGDNGLKLSGGQRQRLSIARAFFKDAPILILDEATSALDNQSESAVTRAIEDLARTRTTLVIAHRLSTILKADRLLVMHDGRIAEAGSHQTLLARGGIYAELYNAELLATDVVATE